MLLDDIYNFQIPDSAEHLLSIDIETSSRKHPNVHFQIHKATNGDLHVHWRLELPISELISVMQSFRNKFFSTETTVPAATVLSDSRFKSELLHHSPINCKAVDSELIRMIHTIGSKAFPENVEKSHGLDGTSFTITNHKNAQTLLFWCGPPREWIELGILILHLLEFTELDVWYRPYIYQI